MLATIELQLLCSFCLSVPCGHCFCLGILFHAGNRYPSPNFIWPFISKFNSSLLESLCHLFQFLGRNNIICVQAIVYICYHWPTLYGWEGKPFWRDVCRKSMVSTSTTQKLCKSYNVKLISPFIVYALDFML